MTTNSLSLLHARPTIAVPGLDRQTTRLIDGSQAFMILYTIGCAYLNAGAFSASVLTMMVFPTYLIYTLITRNPLMIRLMVFGFVVGWVELLADNYAVEVVHSLKYYPDEEPAMVWTSPLYMPFAWTEIVVQVAFLGIRLMQRWGLAVASLVLALVGGLYVFFYENLAKAAGWWHYENVSMLWNTPYFISTTEMLLFLVLPGVMLLIYRKKVAHSVLWGVICGLWIWLGAILTYNIFG